MQVFTSPDEGDKLIKSLREPPLSSYHVAFIMASDRRGCYVRRWGPDMLCSGLD